MRTICLVTLLNLLVYSYCPAQNNTEYSIVIESFDWGPAITKVVIPVKNPESLSAPEFDVYIHRSTICRTLEPALSFGTLPVLSSFPSDRTGNRLDDGDHLALVLSVSPQSQLNVPMQYLVSDKCRGTKWLDFNLEVMHGASGRMWYNEAHRYLPQVKPFDLSGKFVYDDTQLTYAFFKPESDNGQNPLIIWLHGGGEGGTDLTLPLLANRATNYASPEIQSIFGGAHVLVPQTPGAWMHNAQGVSTMGRDDDVYHDALLALIKEYVAQTPDIDPTRIYLGGCSNGGYMTLKLILEDPSYFAAGFPSALAYASEYLSDQDIETLSRVPLWFIHAADDQVTVPERTVLPVVERLRSAQADNLHFSYFDHVIDLTGLFGGDDYHHFGHSSWIYCHANACFTDYTDAGGSHHPSLSIMAWLAMQRRK